ncbi:MAG: serine hydrolase [Acidimicrobiales bacterium]|nr:beta-lactamase family protein [Acidimicrobiia bacterium]NNC79240.1 serine hydrolase [Acidimicrobiales bacterium]RZV45692.1 MAG: class C beta-lactamase-related serine hydrolase [Acidimicrobiales bacterium]
MQGGEVTTERYAPNVDADEKLISWSMGKSITQALIGIAAAEGTIDVDAPAAVSEWSDPDDPRAAITVDHLLRMTSGLSFAEDYVDDQASDCLAMLFGEGKDDCAAYAASQPLIADPGTTFNYSSGTTNILCRLLGDIYGRDDAFSAWADSVLFHRIGMDVDLTFDAAGTWTGSSFLHATARDFVTFGQLYLQDGRWGDDQVLPSGWVEYASTKQAENDEGTGYGAHWWMRDNQPGVFQASGYECQRIIVDPRSDSVVVRLGKTPIELAPNVDAWLDEILAELL